MSSNIDQDFVEFVVKSLVGNPDAVKIDRRVDEKGVLLELTVDPEDLGRVIGKRGATAQSLRTLLRALGTKNEARYNLKIVDNGPEGYEKPARSEQPAADNAAPAVTTDDDEENTEAEVADDAPQQDSTESEDTSNASADDEEEGDEASESDMAKRHRKDLEDLDDLDI